MKLPKNASLVRVDTARHQRHDSEVIRFVFNTPSRMVFWYVELPAGMAAEDLPGAFIEAAEGVRRALSKRKMK